jgi:hemolysin activation/secretion protein
MGLGLWLCLARGVPAQTPPGAAEANRQQQEQLLREQQRQQQYQRQMQPPVDVRLDDPAVKRDALELPRDETPCFPLHEIALTGESAGRFRFALTKTLERSGFQPGQCLGAQGINVIMTLTQNAAIERGYTTTRILAAGQDLKSGRLELIVVPGRIHGIRFVDAQGKALTGRAARHANALPASPGDILNLRELEQALENLKRIPTAEADIQIVPAETPNESDVIVQWTQRRIPFRGMIGLDDAGTRATGRYQANVTLFADSPLGLSDLFYVSYNHHIFRAPRQTNADGHDTRSGTHGWALHYSAPFGNWLLGLNHNAYRYHQAIAGIVENYDYNGKSETSDIGLNRLLYRDASRKTFLGLKLWRRESRNYIDDTEIDIQHRRTFGWALDIDHKEYIGNATAALGLGYRRGTGAGGSLRAPEEDLGEGESRLKIVTADAALAWPFAVGKQAFAYDGSLHAQWNQTRLVLQDRLSIGGRYTVRGFDGETTFAGDRGWIWRNNLGWQYLPAHQIYLGADMGRVFGPSTRTLPGHTLAGAVVGLKGQFLPGGQVYYDIFIGGPVRKPGRFKTDATVAGFNLSYSL